MHAFHSTQQRGRFNSKKQHVSITTAASRSHAQPQLCHPTTPDEGASSKASRTGGEKKEVLHHIMSDSREAKIATSHYD